MQILLWKGGGHRMYYTFFLQEYFLLRSRFNKNNLRIAKARILPLPKIKLKVPMTLRIWTKSAMNIASHTFSEVPMGIFSQTCTWCDITLGLSCNLKNFKNHPRTLRGWYLEIRYLLKAGLKKIFLIKKNVYYITN